MTLNKGSKEFLNMSKSFDFLFNFFYLDIAKLTSQKNF